MLTIKSFGQKGHLQRRLENTLKTHMQLEEGKVYFSIDKLMNNDIIINYGLRHLLTLQNHVCVPHKSQKISYLYSKVPHFARVFFLSVL